MDGYNIVKRGDKFYFTNEVLPEGIRDYKTNLTEVPKALLPATFQRINGKIYGTVDPAELKQYFESKAFANKLKAEKAKGSELSNFGKGLALPVTAFVKAADKFLDTWMAAQSENTAKADAMRSQELQAKYGANETVDASGKRVAADEGPIAPSRSQVEANRKEANAAPAPVLSDSDASPSKATTQNVNPSAATAKVTTSTTTSATGNKTTKTSGGSSASSKTVKDKVSTSNDDTLQWINYLKVTFQNAVEINPDDRKRIGDILAEARQDNWQATKIADAILKRTQWGQTELPSIKNFILYTNNPQNAGTFAEQKRNKKDYIKQYFNQLGYELDDAALDGYVIDSIRLGLDDNQLAARVANDVRSDKIKVRTPGGGEYGKFSTQIKGYAADYGIMVSDDYLKKIQADILDPTDSRDETYYQNLFREQSAELYSPFADQIRAGKSLYDATYGYRNMMAQLLEVGEADIKWDDLMSKVVTKDNQKVSSWDFERMVKNDPRWAYTKNARTSLDEVGRQVLKDFGLVY